MTITIKDLACALARKKGITKKEAIAFVKTMFAVADNGITADGRLNINGLGVFKVIEAAAKKNTNVNTGKHVTIEKHKKLKFIVEKRLAEIVSHTQPDGKATDIEMNKSY